MGPVIVSREQFNLMRLAVVREISKCQDEQERCVKAGLPDVAVMWQRDAEQFGNLLNEIGGT